MYATLQILSHRTQTSPSRSPCKIGEDKEISGIGNNGFSHVEWKTGVTKTAAACLQCRASPRDCMTDACVYRIKRIHLATRLELIKRNEDEFQQYTIEKLDDML